MPINWEVGEETYKVTEEDIKKLFPEPVRLSKMAEIVNGCLPENKRISPSLWFAREIGRTLDIDIGTIIPTEALNLIQSLMYLNPPLIIRSPENGDLIVNPA